jgi:hypothetical protein
MVNTLNMQPATPETIWAILQETAKSQKETEQIVKETVKSQKETEQIVKENAKQLKELRKTVGAWANNHGFFAEEYFINSFEQKKQNFFGEKFDEIEKNVKGIKKGFKDEYDILLINGKSIGIIEIKFKAHENDVLEVIRKAETFRVNFPEYKNHKIYLGLASM